MKTRTGQPENTTSTPTPAAPNTTEAHASRPSARPLRDERSRGRQRTSGLGSWFGILLVLAAAIGVLATGLRGPDSDGALEASTARLEAQAEAFDAGRSARASRAATARLQAQAEAFDAGRSARASRAATARLQAQADRGVRGVRGALGWVQRTRLGSGR